MEESMNDLVQSEMKSNDEPLFVVTYQTWKVTLRFLSWVFAGIFLGFLCGVAMERTQGFGFLLATILEILIVLAAIFLALNTLLFKEVRLYKDRIVKIWRCFRPVDVELADARLEGKRSWQIQCKTFYDRNVEKGQTQKRVVYYDEELMSKEDVGEMNRLLADLSGRRVEEFEVNKITMDPLVKEEKKDV
jgi:hypothetical protein